MVTYKSYESIDGLPHRYRKRVRDLMFEGERFVFAIDTKNGRIRSKHNTKLVLTDSRILRVKAGILRSKSEDYSLSDISSIQFNRGLRNSELVLQGSGIDDTYVTTKRHGEAFASAAREQQLSRS